MKKRILFILISGGCFFLIFSGCKEILDAVLQVPDIVISYPEDNALTGEDLAAVEGYTNYSNVFLVELVVNGDSIGFYENPGYYEEPGYQSEDDNLESSPEPGYHDFNFNFTDVPLSGGTNTIEVTGYDDISEDTLSDSVSIYRDVTAPVITITSPAYGAVIDGNTVSFTGTVTDDWAVAALLFRGPGTLFGNTEVIDSEWSFSLGGLPYDESLSLELMAWDEIGNVSSNVIVFSCVVAP